MDKKHNYSYPQEGKQRRYRQLSTYKPDVNVYKVFAKNILKRITKKLDEEQPKEQAGFRSGYSTLDHIH